MKRIVLKRLATLVMLSVVLGSCSNQGPLRLKIIGGTAVTEQDPLSKSMGLLVDQNGKLSCSVVAISPGVFLTAAHCLFNLSLAGWHVQTGLKLGVGDSLAVESATIHEEYSPASMYSLTPDRPANDLAIIRTTEPWTSAAYVSLLSPEARQDLVLPRSVTIVGYGRTVGNNSASTGTLTSGQVSVTSSGAGRYEFISEQSDGVMGCRGDSGGAAFDTNHKNLLVGIVSRGDSQCTEGKTVYTDVSAYSEFLPQKGVN